MKVGVEPGAATQNFKLALPGKSPRLNFTEATVHDSAQRKRATVCARGNFLYLS
jgi:hypothetical protein